MVLDIGINLDNWHSYNQLDGSVNQYKDCAVANCASIIQWATGVIKTPVQAHDEFWGAAYTGNIDYPAVQTYLQGFARAKSDVYHPTTPANLEAVLADALYWKKVALYLCTLNGVDAHWVTALHQYGADGSATPFDQQSRNNPWGGYVEQQSWTDWRNTLMRYQGDGNFLAVVVERTRSILNDARMGP